MIFNVGNSLPRFWSKQQLSSRLSWHPVRRSPLFQTCRSFSSEDPRRKRFSGYSSEFNQGNMTLCLSRDYRYIDVARVHMCSSDVLHCRLVPAIIENLKLLLPSRFCFSASPSCERSPRQLRQKRKRAYCLLCMLSSPIFVRSVTLWKLEYISLVPRLLLLMEF